MSKLHTKKGDLIIGYMSLMLGLGVLGQSYYQGGFFNSAEWGAINTLAFLHCMISWKEIRRARSK